MKSLIEKFLNNQFKIFSSKLYDSLTRSKITDRFLCQPFDYFSHVSVTIVNIHGKVRLHFSSLQFHPWSRFNEIPFFFFLFGSIGSGSCTKYMDIINRCCPFDWTNCENRREIKRRIFWKLFASGNASTAVCIFWLNRVLCIAYFYKIPRITIFFQRGLREFNLYFE